MKTVARVAQEMLEDPNLSERTQLIYSDILSRFLNLHGYRDINDIGKDDIKEFLAHWENNKHKTYNLSHSVVNRLFNWAFKQEYVEQNPASKVFRRKPNRSKGEVKEESVTYLRPEQLTSLFRSARSNLRLFSLLHLLYDSGARITEILDLNLSDIRYAQSEFKVIGKGNKARVCYFRGQTGLLLQNYITEARETHSRALFTERLKRSREVRRLTYQSAYSDLKDACRGNPLLAGVGFHQLRHTFATERANKIPIESLKALLGHESIATTQIYQKVTSQAAKQAAMDAFDLLKGKAM